ncbi:MAG TPA: PaaX family transcriptional regulator C-terminal domain-containing protein [Actinomycetes bacterium]|nr:PaaX family transcriptional regulator C-terminal domain-containing protein [Actinomycetes bacterium]
MAERNGRAQPQRLLVTLLGDYWRSKSDPIPSAALVALLGEFGIGHDGARSALSRLSRRGMLRCVRQGRRTAYELTDSALAYLDDGAEVIFGFGPCGPPWDEMWSLIAFSVAERERSSRHQLRSRLRWLTFAPLYDGLWISPHDRLADAAALIDELGLDQVTLFRAAHVVVPGASGRALRTGVDVRRVWQLDELRTHYERFVGELEPLRRRVHAGQVTASEALIMRTQVMNAWRQFPREDPDLPAEFMPADWPRPAAHELFHEIYHRLGPVAEVRVAQLVEQAR